MRAELIAQARGVQPEEAGDLRNIVRDILCIAASGNRILVFGARSRSLTPRTAQPDIRNPCRRTRHTVARQQQVAAVFVQIAPKTPIRNTALRADRTDAHIRRSVQ